MGNLGSVSLEETETIALVSQRTQRIQGPQEEEVRFIEGAMKKQPVGNMLIILENRWKSRYFILKRGGIAYYEVTREMTIDWQDTTISLQGHINGLGYLYHVSHMKQQSDTIPQSAIQHQIAVPCQLQEVTLEALLKVKKLHLLLYAGTYWETWKEMHILPCSKVDNVTLQERYQLGLFPVSGATVEVTTPLVFHIKSADGRYLSLMCSKQQDASAWIQSITNEAKLSTCETITRNPLAHEFYNVLHDILEQDRKERVPCVIKPLSLLDETPLDGTLLNGTQDRDLILALDGGGIRGIVACVILERLMKRYPSLLSRVKFIAGTSNGSMIAMALACGYSIQTIRKMMELTCRYVFSEQQSRYSLYTAKWSNQFLHLFCREVWKDVKMKDANVPCLVPSLLLDNKDPTRRCIQTMTYNSLIDKEELVSDVVMRSCAAPTYFPSWQGHVDGGFWSQSPADLALTHLVGKDATSLASVKVLSISTGYQPHYVEAEEHNYGTFQWLNQMIPTFWHGMTQKSSLICDNLIGDRYHRVDPCLDKNYPLDAAEMVPELVKFATEIDLAETFAWIEKHI